MVLLSSKSYLRGCVHLYRVNNGGGSPIINPYENPIPPGDGIDCCDSSITPNPPIGGSPTPVYNSYPNLGVDYTALGYDSAISYNGSLVAVSNEASSTEGVVQVYEDTGSGFSVRQTLRSDISALEDGFGNSVSLDRNGNKLAVGAAYQYGTGGEKAVYIYDKSSIDGLYYLDEKITLESKGQTTTGRFGYKVCMSSCGETLAVLEDGSNKTYIFRKNFIADTWDLHQTFTDSVYNIEMSKDSRYLAINSDSEIKVYYSNFVSDKSTPYSSYNTITKVAGMGHSWGIKSMSFNSTGNFLAIGAPNEDTTDMEAGAIEIYENNNVTSTFSRTQIIRPSNDAGGNQFGWGVGFSYTGEELVATTYPHGAGDWSMDYGAIYYFKKSVSTSTWNETGLTRPPFGDSTQTFGANVSISGDGSTTATASIYEDDYPNYNTVGKLFIYR